MTPVDRRSAYLEALGIDEWLPRSPAPQPGVTPLPPTHDGRALDADPASLDWAGLEAAVAGCRRCDLHATRTRPVFGVGHRRAEWFIVGEAPGEDEDQRGEPFVGRAGGLLDAMLRAVGLPRDQVYIANLLKSRPPKNRDPRPDEVAACLPYLLRQIQLVQPRLLLAVGRHAAQALVGSEETIGRLRGRVYRFGADGIPLVVTYHPSYLLRVPGEKRKAWDDLKLALATSRPRSPQP